MIYKNKQEIELEVIHRFCIKSKKDRFRSFILNPKNRVKFIRELHNMSFLDFKLFNKILGDEGDLLRQRLKEYGLSQECYIISENEKIDQIFSDTENALREVIGSDLGSIIVFGNIDLVYCELEGFNNRWISKVNDKINKS